MRQVFAIICTFIGWTLVGILSKVLFMLIYGNLVPEAEISDWMSVIGYGLRLDIAIAGYLTMLQGLLLLIVPQNQIVRNVYVIIAALIYSVAIVSNLGLYGYWGFPLDSTPVLYIKTSPADAMASVTLWQMACGVTGILVMTALTYWLQKRLYVRQVQAKGVWQNVYPRLLTLVLTAALLLPIRGGLGTGTNHTGSVYFSQNMRLNHAAVNPAFSFMESMLHRTGKFAAEYDFGLEQYAVDYHKELSGDPNNINVVILGLESFSDTIMHVEGVTPCLNRIAAEGWHFTNFYSNTFRTDRALVSMLSGQPSLPNLSLMDLPKLSTSLPSIARTLGRIGYQTSFYYGGDTNYSNMRSYLIGTGYQNVVSDKDFAKELHTGKWGVADGPVYNRMLGDIAKMKEPFLVTMMTESSHEPFDVPNHRVFDNGPQNAFNYADSCLGVFISKLKQTEVWSRTLVVIVPDHVGAWPETLDNYDYGRFRIPLIMIGGVIEEHREIETYGAQMDMAATILGMLNIENNEFEYSKDLLNDSLSHFGYFSFPNAVGIVTDSARVIYDYTQHDAMCQQGVVTDSLVKTAQAIMQRYSKEMEARNEN